MNTSIVLPLSQLSTGFGSRWSDTELRYCLRSVERHLTGYGDIFIIGHLPNWVKNVIHIPATDDDKTYWKERNIFNKIMLACNDERVSEDFLFMNDDHYLLKDYEAGEFPYYYEGTLMQMAGRKDQYSNTIANTANYLIHAQQWVKFLDIHCPIIYNRDKFIEGFNSVNWPKYGYCIKTMYGNCIHLNAEKGKPRTDLKIDEENLSSSQIKNLIAGRAWFSIGQKAQYGGMEKVLQELYPLKSKYEK